MFGKLVIVTVVVAILFGAAAGNVVDSLTNHGEDRFGNISVGAVGGAFGSLLLQFMVPALSGFDDWRFLWSRLCCIAGPGFSIIASGQS